MSPVTIGELNTEVRAEQPPAAASSGAAAPSTWEQLDRLRAGAAELERLRDRTRAEGFDA